MTNGKLLVMLTVIKDGSSGTLKLTITGEKLKSAPTNVSITGYTVPAGTYRSGETVPVTVQFSDPVKAKSTTKLTINGTACPALDVETESKSLTFGYTVKESDAASISVGTLSNIYNYLDATVALSGNNGKSIGSAEGVSVQSNGKSASVNVSGAKWGIDDAAPGQQTVTVVVPLNSGSDLNWVTSEAQSISGTGVSMALPGL